MEPRKPKPHPATLAAIAAGDEDFAAYDFEADEEATIRADEEAREEDEADAEALAEELAGLA